MTYEISTQSHLSAKKGKAVAIVTTLQPVKHRSGKMGGPSNTENNPNTNPNIYTVTYV